MGNKFTAFLIVVSLAIVAFMGGYLLSQEDFNSSEDQKSTILSRFSNSYSSPTDINSSTPTESNDLIKIGRSGIVSPITFGQNNLLAYFDTSTGKSYTINIGTKKEELLSDSPFANFIDTLWSLDTKRVIIVTYSPKGNEFHYIDYTNKLSNILAGPISSFAFSPSGESAVYFSKKSDDNKIYLSQSDGSSPKSLLTTRIPDLDVYWQKNDVIYFKTNDTKSDLFILNKDGSLLKIIKSQEALDLKWSPSGKKLLYSHQENDTNQLTLRDLVSGNETSIRILTQASRCAWSLNESHIFCVVARTSGPVGDDLYEIGLLDGSQKLLLSPATKVSAKEVLLSTLENYLIVLDSLTSQLYYTKIGN